MRRLALLLLLFGMSITLTAQQDLFVLHRKMMMEAIAKGQVEKVKALLKTPYIIINDPERCGYVGWAAEKVQPTIVDILIEAGEEVDYEASIEAHCTMTALHSAGFNVCSRCMASIIAKLKQGTPKDRILYLINSENVIRGFESLTPLLFAINSWSPSKIGEDLQPRGRAEMERELSEEVHLLVDNGADVTIKLANNIGVLDIAKGKLSQADIKYLIDHGAQPAK